jgi:hypothetical protein
MGDDSKQLMLCKFKDDEARANIYAAAAADGDATEYKFQAFERRMVPWSDVLETDNVNNPGHCQKAHDNMDLRRVPMTEAAFKLMIDDYEGAAMIQWERSSCPCAYSKSQPSNWRWLSRLARNQRGRKECFASVRLHDFDSQ